MNEPKPRPILHRAGPRPITVTWAARAATANLLGGILLLFWGHFQLRSLAFIPPEAIPMLLSLYVIRMFFRGRNWARILYIAGTVLGWVVGFRQLMQLDPLFIEVIAFFMLGRAIDAAVIGLLLAAPSNEWFRLPLVQPPASRAA